MNTYFIDLVVSIILKLIVFLFLYGFFPNFFKWIFRKVVDVYYVSKKIRIFIYKCFGMGPAQLAGRDAERRYQRLLFFQFGCYRVLKDVYLPHPYKENRFTEIDVLVIHRRGVFSGEIKNYSGLIYGKSSNKEWLLEGKNRRFYFRNPFLQNQLHIDALIKALPKYEDKVFGFVGMLKNSDINYVEMDGPPTPNGHNQAFFTENYIRKSYFSFNKYYKKNSPFKRAEMEDIYRTLKPHTNRSKEFKHQHLAEIENDFKEKATKKIEVASEKIGEANEMKKTAKPNNIIRIY